MNIERVTYWLQESRRFVDKYETLLDFHPFIWRHMEKSELRSKHIQFKTIELISSDNYQRIMEKQ